MNGLLSKNMRYFIAVMDERNISHAAQNLHITRSPLGKAIVELEVGIGSKLFIRKGNMLEPTEQAIHLYCQLKPVFENLLSIEERFFYKKNHNQLRLYVDEDYPHNLYQGIKSLQYIKDLRIKIEKKALNESTLTAMLNDPRSAFLTLHQETLQGEQGRPLLMCKPKRIYLLYANNSINESKSITEIFLDNVIIKGGYISSEKFSDCLSFCSPEVPLTLPILSEDIDLASMLNLISSGKAVSFVPEGFLKFCEEGISSVVMNNITMMPKILCVGNGRKYFEEVAEFINSY